MNFHIIRNIIGYIMLIEAVFMVPALLISTYQNESSTVLAFLITIALLTALGLPMASIRAKRKSYYAREGFVTVGLGWIVVSLFGALPFTLSGGIPSYVDAFFETVSGFTTTGASILDDIESLPMGLLYWRSFTHWLGGMGVLVFLLAIGPLSGDSGDALYLLRAESPGVNVGKLVPRMRRSALILYQIYIVLTILQFVLLLLGDVPLFDSLTLSMATAGTGGFAIKNTSVASYSTYAQAVITVFMFLFGVNFNVYYFMLLRQFRRALRNEEFFVYLGSFLLATAVIVWNVFPLFDNALQAIHHVAFTVASVMSTTGFATVDFDLWPQLSRMLLLLLMFMGASAGSTGGGAKVIRIVILLKSARRTIQRALHPNAVCLVHVDGELVDDDTVDSVNNFMLIYFLFLAGLVLLLSLDGLDFETTFSSVVSCVNNIGPGLNLTGPTLNYSCFSAFGKILLSVGMLFGRLEIFPMLMLVAPQAWRK